MKNFFAMVVIYGGFLTVAYGLVSKGHYVLGFVLAVILLACTDVNIKWEDKN